MQGSAARGLCDSSSPCGTSTDEPARPHARLEHYSDHPGKQPRTPPNDRARDEGLEGQPQSHSCGDRKAAPGLPPLSSTTQGRGRGRDRDWAQHPPHQLLSDRNEAAKEMRASQATSRPGTRGPQAGDRPPPAALGLTSDTGHGAPVWPAGDRGGTLLPPAPGLPPPVWDREAGPRRFRLKASLNLQVTTGGTRLSHALRRPAALTMKAKQNEITGRCKEGRRGGLAAGGGRRPPARSCAGGALRAGSGKEGDSGDPNLTATGAAAPCTAPTAGRPPAKPGSCPVPRWPLSRTLNPPSARADFNGVLSVCNPES